MNAIELSHVSKSFRDFSLEDLNFILPEGCICGLVGENGAGKTTMIRLLTGALRADSGDLKTLGADVSAKDFYKTKQDIGVVLDDAWFPGMMTALQVERVMEKTYVNWDGVLYHRFLEKFSLPEKKYFKDYSRGMRMKLAIAVALSHDPKLLVLDEATAGLDPLVRDEVLDVFNEYTREEHHSILMSSHILSDLEKISDYIAFLHKGRLLFCEEKDRLLEAYGIFEGTVDQADSLMEGAIVHREGNGFGGVRALVKRDMVPEGFSLTHASIEDIILNLVKEENRK
ncbi:MAG: ABC transporter ATP-binding protein [Lachnospiraceae bacterium]|nr:ABC transporter ATP-binding protein [Lachnospiraceae bacterium]